MSKSLHDRVVNSLGRAIVDREIAAGTVILAQELELKFGVSRSVVREAVRVLQSLGMTESIKRVGIKVQPVSSWNALDPQLIRWRMSSADQGAQLRALTELRAVVEPAAAALAAQFAPADRAVKLIELAATMRDAAARGDRPAFAQADTEFHAILLRSSGNEMFAGLDQAISEVIRGRSEHGMMPKHPTETSVRRHEIIARAIQSQDPELARSTMVEIMERTASELEQVWSTAPRIF